MMQNKDKDLDEILEEICETEESDKGFMTICVV